MAVAIEDAGFEIRDQIMWVYGSGFPKSHNISKGIDKQNGKHERDLQPFADYVKQCRKLKGWSLAQLDEVMGTNTAASWWEGRKSGIQPPHLDTYKQLKIVLEMDNRFDELIDWLEAEREVVGKGSSTLINSTGTYAVTNGEAGEEWKPKDYNITAPATPAAQQWDGWGTALKPAHEPMVLARKPLEGTVANNVLTYGVGGLNIDGTRVVSDDWDEKTVLGKYRGTNEGNDSVTNNFGVKEIKSTNTESTLIGRFPANFIHDGSDEVVGLFPTNAGGGFGKRGALNGGATSWGFKGEMQEVGYGDSGSAARFFYCAKASKKDRNEGLDGFQGKEIGAKGNGLARTCATCGASVIDGCNCTDRTFVNPVRANHHPTVKPTTLMQYLVRLVTPPNGTVLDPFMGSGSTGKACAYEGFDFIGIDQSAEYVEIAQARIDFAIAHKADELDL
jgi:transcriptional regulator with XRE-family HTH domain